MKPERGCNRSELVLEYYKTASFPSMMFTLLLVKIFIMLHHTIFHFNCNSMKDICTNVFGGEY